MPGPALALELQRARWCERRSPDQRRSRKRAGQPTELHLFSGLDHFLFAENNPRVWNVLHNWLENYFPAKRP